MLATESDNNKKIRYEWMRWKNLNKKNVNTLAEQILSWKTILHLTQIYKKMKIRTIQLRDTLALANIWKHFKPKSVKLTCLELEWFLKYDLVIIFLHRTEFKKFNH